MRFSSAAVLVAVLLFGSSAPAAKLPRMAVLQLRPYAPEQQQTANTLTELLQTDIAKTRRFEVIGQAEIAAMIGYEKQRKLLGCSDDSSNCLAEIGGALGADYILQGTMGKVGSYTLLDISIIDIRRNRPVARDGVRVKTEDELIDGAEAALSRMLQAVGSADGKPAPEKAPLPVVEKPETPAAVASVDPAPAPDAKASSGGQPGGRGALPFVVLGGGVLLGGAGAYAVHDALSYNTQKSTLTYDEAVTRRASAQRWLVGGWTLAGLGAAACVTGAVLAFMPAEAPAPALVPVTGGAALSFGGRF